NPVVLVALIQGTIVFHAQEVQRDAEFNGGEVREPQRRRLVGDAERVPEILDRNISSFFPLRQVRQRRRTRDQARRGEVGDLQPLPKEVRIGGRLGVAENSVPNCLQ